MDDMKIGGMHADLDIDVRGWFDGLADAQDGLAAFANEVKTQFKALEDTIRNVALGLTAAISVPFAGMAIVSKRGAGAFEKSMNNVHAALRGINGEQLDALSAAARKLGPDVGRSAKEAADGIETLALAGMGARDILDGGLAQTLRLAAANAAGLGESAAVVTDVMAQFGKGTGDLEGVVNQVTGALDASKLGFDDFKDAIAQGGGVAGAAGVSFEDFNTALAGTAALFGSGSDAGTSFKTFITTLTPKSKEAAAMMEKLGLDFYDATGRMKDLSDIAEMLREKLGNLSDRSRTDVLNTLFGTDGMRTAIGLMRLGGQQFDALQKAIGQTDAGEKLAIQLDGAEASSGRLTNAFDELKIALGETGILAAFTMVQDALASTTRWLAELPLGLRQVVVGIWGMTAVIGPMVLALMGIAKVVAPVILLRGSFGVLGAVVSGLVNPIGTMVALLGQLAIKIAGVSVALRALGLALTAWAGWIGLAVTGLTLLALWLGRSSTATSAASAASAKATAALERQQAASLGLVSATGAARKAIIDKMKADRASELQALATARADVVAAQAELARAKKAPAGQPGSSIARFGYLPGADRNRPVEDAVKDAEVKAETLATIAKTIEGYTQSINTPEFGTVDLNLGGTDSSAGPSAISGRSAQEIADRREQMRIEQQLAVARARDDRDEVRRLQDKLDLVQRRRDYEDAGLATAAARIAAERDIADIKAAEAEFDAREIARAEDAFDLRLAEIRGDEALIRLKEDQAFLTEQTVMWQSKGLTLLDAQKRAANDLVQMEVARADALAQAARNQALDRDAELSRLRGDTDAQQRAATRAAELERRAQQYYRDGAGKVSEDSARERADSELSQEEMARQQGQWRDTIRGGLRAALDGDVGSFVSSWWKDNVARGMEEALNSLSDMLFNLFKQAMGQGGGASGGGLGGLIGGIGSALSGAFGGNGLGGVSASSLSHMDGLAAQLAVPRDLPGFATGGSFEVGGKPGIDTNLVSFWGTAGETVNVRRAGANDDGGSNSYHFSGNLMTPEFWALIQAGDSAASAQAVGMTERRASRRAKRRMGR